MLTRAAARRLHPPQWRALSTSTETSLKSQNSRRGPPNRNASPKAWYPEENLRSLHPRMIFVRPWDGIQSMAHAFAIIREIERRFGKIEEFVVLRDSDVLTTNMPYMHATFAKAKYADAIPLEGRVIQVTAPPTNVERNGGIGLDDLEVYLDPAARADALSGEAGEEGEGQKEREWGPPGRDVMDIKLERSGMSEPPTPVDFTIGANRPGPPYLRSVLRTNELADAMLAFGGFAEAPSDSTDGRTPMQNVMAKWGRIAGRSPKAETRQHKKAETAQPSAVIERRDAIVVDEEVPWTPFTQADQTSAPDAPLSPSSIPPSPTPSLLPPSPTPSSLPPSPTPSSLPPSPTPSLLPPSATPPPLVKPSPSPSQTLPPPKPTPKPTPKPKPAQPAAPQLSKKQRMLLAARSAGAVAASQPAAQNGSENLDTPAHSSDASADGTTAYPSEGEARSEPEDAATRAGENKLAARKWWNFLTGGKG